ncbi:MAG: hypothetical protein DRI57_29270 [Deltaproteobacteria bacterium]|nr:MAG: hypothetical protein DRI57_29270 [Deltaproteobacteria bacterium]
MKSEFEWDKNKAAKNTRKHRVSFDEAKSVFDDPGFIAFNKKFISLYFRSLC